MDGIEILSASGWKVEFSVGERTKRSERSVEEIKMRS